MWVMTSDSFVSIVEHRDDPNLLLVRGRFPGDVARFLGLDPSLEEFTPVADYRYRIAWDRGYVAQRCRRAADEISYPNFKSSVKDGFRRVTLMETWEIWYDAQHRYHRRDPEPDISVEGVYGGTD